MLKTLVLGSSVSSLLIASVAWACGGAPPMPTPGYTGTTVAERGGTVSIFSGSAQGYSWDRITLPSTDRQHVGQVPGVFSGSVETDARVNTGIAGESGRLVEFGDHAATPLSDGPEAQTDVFGAALSSDLKWNVFAYDGATRAITWFFESNPGRFDKLATLNADCGAVLMLDVVAEDDGTIEGLCGKVVFEVSQNKLQTVELPIQQAHSLSRGSDGQAVIYGTPLKNGGLQVLRHDKDGWKDAGLIATPEPEVVYALDENSVLVRHYGGFTSYTAKNGQWQASSALDASTAVTSVKGAPVQVFAGSYDLTLYTTDGSANAQWTATRLGAIGQLPQPGRAGTGGGGCTIVGTAIPFALLGLMSMTRFRKRFAKR